MNNFLIKLTKLMFISVILSNTLKSQVTHPKLKPDKVNAIAREKSVIFNLNTSDDKNNNIEFGTLTFIPASAIDSSDFKELKVLKDEKKPGVFHLDSYDKDGKKTYLGVFEVKS